MLQKQSRHATIVRLIDLTGYFEIKPIATSTLLSAMHAEEEGFTKGFSENKELRFLDHLFVVDLSSRLGEFRFADCYWYCNIIFYESPLW